MRYAADIVPGIDQPGEREALGVEGASRGAALEEVLELARSWWAGVNVDAGLSKLVIRPAAGVSSWEDEVEWLAGAVLDLQT